MSRILAQDDAGRRIAQLWPPYENVVPFRGDRFVVATAVSEAEETAARALLDRLHDKGAARHGLLICLYARDTDDHRELIGVAQLGEYYHTRPPGRDAFSLGMNGPDYHRLTRGEEIRAVPIVAAKRFAIAEHRWGEGLAQLLARQTLKVARNHRWPPARVVEVIRYQAATGFFALCCRRKRDFLVCSGYIPVPPAEWISNGQIDARFAAIPSPRRMAGYYFADLTDAGRPGYIERARVAEVG